jgi:hypothetical protein
MRMGLRGVADPDSVGCYLNITDERKEYERKVRTVVRGISVLMRGLPLIDPRRNPLFAWQLLSHKLCRWLVPFAMVAAFVANAALASASQLYVALFVLQAAFYAVALAGLVFKPLLRIAPVRLAAYFVLVNVSILHAWLRYWSGERLVLWEPSKR